MGFRNSAPRHFNSALPVAGAFLLREERFLQFWQLRNFGNLGNYPHPCCHNQLLAGDARREWFGKTAGFSGRAPRVPLVEKVQSRKGGSPALFKISLQVP